ncbi:MxaK protein [Rivibacter subsaxonicus]|uniref:MxaK protein n=1 Tax=Rivibacter subsaxonicus TaxID=457575 RepID=A0A4Q7VEW7_9BURK|nr:MxaK protein [Rivibacter subsaxonicus]RZT93812.1 mxaK protein [Rivibacter subsaxonicus]
MSRQIAIGRHRAWVALLLVLLLALGGWRALHQKQAWNDAIQATAAASPASAASHPLPEGDAPAHWHFAQAVALAADGQEEAALARYRGLFDDPALAAAARFNSANLLLRQGLRLRESSQPGQALALLELAKEGYRALLRADPQHWDARYNLERALRLQPDAEPDETAPPSPPLDAERAATTARGSAQGLP